jgi:hypothetical protein
MRLRSDIWVMAYLRRCQSAGVAVVVMRRGDAHAGAIYLCINHLNGSVALFGPAPAGMVETSIERRWTNCLNQILVSEQEAQAYLARQLEFDPDIWIVEVEDKQGRHFLDEDAIEELR